MYLTFSHRIRYEYMLWPKVFFVVLGKFYICARNAPRVGVFANRVCRRRHSTSSLHRAMTAIIRIGKLGASRCETLFTFFIADDKFPGLPCHELRGPCTHTYAHICIQHFYDGRSMLFLSK